jgi:outer membrane protein, heavy metal efflux system
MRAHFHALMIFALHATWAMSAGAQESAVDAPPGGVRRERSAPGAQVPSDNPSQGAIIGGRPGSLRPRVPLNRSKSRTPSPLELSAPQPPEAGVQPVHVPNAWSILLEIHDPGPASGLTLDQAMERLVRANISLRAKSLDIGQAQADVLTAGMRANPVVYADKQLIPYRPYNSVTNPGGPAQYDLNLAYPADLSGKRHARVEVAVAAQRVVEALYQDAVRLEIDRLYTAYVDALAARLALRTTRDGLVRIDEIRKRSGDKPREPRDDQALMHQIQIQRQTVALALIDAESAWKTSKRALSIELNLSREESAALDLRGTLEDDFPAPPSLNDLVAAAFANRPDVAAYRLGFQRAGSDVRLAQANRLPDVYLLYQPFTYQDNSPFHQPSSQSWAVGATVTVPLFDRNQGNIRRAELNADQTQLELRALEQRVASEVEGAYDDYVATRQGIEQVQKEVLPYIEQSLGESLEHFHRGTLDAAGYLTAQRDLDDLGRQYRDLLVRHRRSMLAVNTAVGKRIFP